MKQFYGSLNDSYLKKKKKTWTTSHASAFTYSYTYFFQKTRKISKSDITGNIPLDVHTRKCTFALKSCANIEIWWENVASVFSRKKKKNMFGLCWVSVQCCEARTHTHTHWMHSINDMIYEVDSRHKRYYRNKLFFKYNMHSMLRKRCWASWELRSLIAHML